MVQYSLLSYIPSRYFQVSRSCGSSHGETKHFTPLIWAPQQHTQNRLANTLGYHFPKLAPSAQITAVFSPFPLSHSCQPAHSCAFRLTKKKKKKKGAPTLLVPLSGWREHILGWNKNTVLVFVFNLHETTCLLLKWFQCKRSAHELVAGSIWHSFGNSYLLSSWGLG